MKVIFCTAALSVFLGKPLLMLPFTVLQTLIVSGSLGFTAYSKSSVKRGNKGQNTCGDNIITWCLLIDLEVKSIEWD